MRKRVVITGLGVVSPNGVGVPEFTEAIKNGVSGIKYFPELHDLNFSCHLGAMPIISEEKKREYLSELQLRNFNSSGILYGIIAGMDALRDAKLKPAEQGAEPIWDLGIIFGSGTSGVEKFREASLLKVFTFMPKTSIAFTSSSKKFKLLFLSRCTIQRFIPSEASFFALASPRPLLPPKIIAH